MNIIESIQIGKEYCLFFEGQQAWGKVLQITQDDISLQSLKGIINIPKELVFAVLEPYDK
jgi:hypothetical protein